MKILDKETLDQLPRLYSNEHLKANQIKVIIKLFLLFSGFAWYITEYDPEEKVFFGFANLNDDQIAELGYFSLKELEEFAASSPFPFPIQRDFFWDKNTTLEDVISFKKR